MRISVHDLMDSSGVRFGTSGARGLAAEMTDLVCYVYTRAFLSHLTLAEGWNPQGAQVAVAGDLRPSTGRIMRAVFRAVQDAGASPVNCGRIPSPAVALYGLVTRMPSVMVTGSHIPADRNGIKFNKCAGEILKQDEEGIRRQVVEVPVGVFDGSGGIAAGPVSEPPLCTEARRMYAARYIEAFALDSLAGKRLGVYQHSSVARELMIEILRGLGAEVTALGHSEEFVPVDTEAIRPEDVRLAREWAREHRFDAIISADGDGDRPLVADEHGCWLRGDVAGILCAKYLRADSVSVPVSCNSAVGLCGWFKEVRRTRIGSPYVIESMQEAAAAGAQRVVGYEANGGFLIQSDLEPLLAHDAVTGHSPLTARRSIEMLRALPTRDAMIVPIGILLLAARERKTVAQLVADLPQRHTASDRLKNFPIERSQAILRQFSTGGPQSDRRAIEAVFGGLLGRLADIDRTDGLRMTFVSGDVLHLRPSGNAPEFRCYAEAGSPERAARLTSLGLDLLKDLPVTPGCQAADSTGARDGRDLL